MLRIALSTLAGPQERHARRASPPSASRSSSSSPAASCSSPACARRSRRAARAPPRSSSRSSPTVASGAGRGRRAAARAEAAAGLASPTGSGRCRACRAAIADRSFPLRVLGHDDRALTGDDDAPAVGHGWESAALTPLRLVSGHVPQGDRGGRARHRPCDPRRVRARRHGADHDRRHTSGASPSSASLRRRAGDPRRGKPRSSSATTSPRVCPAADREPTCIGVLLDAGADPGTVADDVRRSLAGADLRVLTGARRGEAESPDDALGREDIVAGLTVFALLAAFVAIFVVGEHVRALRPATPPRARPLPRDRKHAAAGAADGRRRGAARLARRGRRRRSARCRRRTARARILRERRHAARGPRHRRRLASVRGRPRDGDRHHPARRLRQRPPGVPDPPDRRAARGLGTALAPSRSSGDWPAWPLSPGGWSF